MPEVTPKTKAQRPETPKSVAVALSVDISVYRDPYGVYYDSAQGGFVLTKGYSSIEGVIRQSTKNPIK